MRTQLVALGLMTLCMLNGLMAFALYRPDTVYLPNMQDILYICAGLALALLVERIYKEAQ